MKKGFTLVELLAVIAILGVIALIAIPAVDRAIDEGKDQMLETQKAQIIKGAKDYLAVNTDELPSSGSTITLTVGELQNAGFLELNIQNPKSDDYVVPTAQIQVKSIGNGFQYTVDEDSMTGTSTVTDGPTIVLSGGNIQYVELGSKFTDKGYSATSSYGADITANVVRIPKDINTSSVGTYTITYSVTEPNDSTKTATAKRTVMVVDTTKPNITLAQSSITLSAIEVPTYNFLGLVTATDNSGVTPIVNFTSNISQIAGMYTVTYTAEDFYGNRATKKLYVTVNEAINFTATNPDSYEDKKTVTISFPTVEGMDYLNQYSTDYGLTWQTVSTSSISLEFTNTAMIIARLADGDDTIMSVTYTITRFNND